MTIRPPLRDRLRLTLVPSRRRRSSSTRSRSGSSRLGRGRRRRRLARLAQPADQLLGLAHGQALLDDRAEHVGLALDAEAAERAPVALA